MSEQKSVSVEFLKRAFDSLPSVNSPNFGYPKRQVPVPYEVSVLVEDAPMKPKLMRNLTFEFNYSKGEWEMLLDA